MGFSRQEYWSGLSFPSPGNLPDPGIKPGSPALQADSLASEPPGSCAPCQSQGQPRVLQTPTQRAGSSLAKEGVSEEPRPAAEPKEQQRQIAGGQKVCLVKTMVSPVVIYGYESWTIKKAKRQRIDVFELWCWRRLLKSPLDCKEIQPVHPKRNQCLISIGRTEAEAEMPIFWPPDVKS